MFKTVLPDRKKDKLSFSQPTLVDEYLPKSDILAAHNAINDVRMLDKLLKTLNVDKNIIIGVAQSLSYVMNKKERLKKMKDMKSSLLNLGLSKLMTGRIVNAGMDINSLKEACKTNGYDGLYILLAGSVNKKPRVTSNKKIIQHIYAKMIE